MSQVGAFPCGSSRCGSGLARGNPCYNLNSMSQLQRRPVAIQPLVIFSATPAQDTMPSHPSEAEKRPNSHQSLPFAMTDLALRAYLVLSRWLATRDVASREAPVTKI